MIPLLLALSVAARAADAPQISPDFSDARTRGDAQLEVIRGLVDAGLPAQALQAVKEVRATGLESTELDVLQARAMLNSGLRDDALALLTRVARKHPRDASALAVYGVALADAGKLDASIATLEKAKRIHPDDPQILNNLGYARMVHGDLDEAMVLFRASLMLDPTQLRPRNNLGFALARQERDNEALDAFRAGGDEADARYNLGVACELRSDRTSAIANYQAAIDAQPGHPAAKAALARLLSPGTP